jgi:hypothetical protein
MASFHPKGWDGSPWTPLGISGLGSTFEWVGGGFQ